MSSVIVSPLIFFVWKVHKTECFTDVSLFCRLADKSHFLSLWLKVQGNVLTRADHPQKQESNLDVYMYLSSWLTFAPELEDVWSLQLYCEDGTPAAMFASCQWSVTPVCARGCRASMEVKELSKLRSNCATALCLQALQSELNWIPHSWFHWWIYCPMMV